MDKFLVLRFIVVFVTFCICSLSAFSQKMLRTKYQTMFTEFPVLKTSLMTDKYKECYYQVNEMAQWNYASEGNIEVNNMDYNKEDVFRILFKDSIGGWLQYWYFFKNPQDFICDSITFCGEVLMEGKNNDVSFLLKQQKKSEEVKLKTTFGWQRFCITQPYCASIDEDLLMLCLNVRGRQGGTVYLKNLNVLLDGRSIDECHPLPPANHNHEFDYSSGFHFPSRPLSNKEIERLVMICKVWGIYKYRHPSIRSGQYDWNFQLFRMLSSALYVKKNKDFLVELMKWLPDNNSLIDDNFVKFTDPVVACVGLNWINQYEKTGELFRDLTFLKSFVNNVPCYCLGYMQGKDRHLFFYNESDYDAILPSDDGYRMLALFRFWNMIYYFHPYIYRMEKKWELLLPYYIRLFAEAKDRRRLEEACIRLTCELKDVHSVFFGCKENIQKKVWRAMWLPFNVRLFDEKVVIDSFYGLPPDTCELKVGDVIVAVNHQLIRDIRKDRSIYHSFDKESTDRYALAYTSFDGDSVVYTIERDGRCMDIMIADVYDRYWEKRKRLYQPEHDAFYMLSDSICYLDLSLLTSEQLRKNMEQAKQCKGIVFDMRGYPKTSECADIIASYLYPHRKALFYFSYADCYQPGVFRKNPHFQEYGMENPDYYKGTPVVLVNGLTMSEAEFVATMIGNAPKGYVIGEPTSGVYGNVLYIPFISGIATRITGRGAYWFDGTCTFPEGVQIDRYVYPTIESTKEGKDSMLEEAIKYIMNN